MKIKSVVELTGLSDRTIRYYIEEGLIFPQFTENYLGRKSFNFSQEDIDELNNVAVLRKFDFTVEEIKEILYDVTNSTKVIQNVKNRNEQTLSAEQLRRSVLSQIEDNKIYTVAQLAIELSNAAISLEKTEEEPKKNIIKTILTATKVTLNLLIVWLPVVFQLFFFAITLIIYSYPVFPLKTVIYIALSVLPTLLMLFIRNFKQSWKKIVRMVLLLLCSISLICSLVVGGFPAGILARSETRDFINYRDFDADCLANRDDIFQELFPAWPIYFENVIGEDGHSKTEHLDAHYYYRFIRSFDYTYDVYAEWPLKEAEFVKEVDRVTELFKKHKPDQKSHWKYETFEKGNYTCLALYDGDALFEKETDSYTYYIFAYDKETFKVRYLVCSSLENGADQPYYLLLDW